LSFREAAYEIEAGAMLFAAVELADLTRNSTKDSSRSQLAAKSNTTASEALTLRSLSEGIDWTAGARRASLALLLCVGVERIARTLSVCGIDRILSNCSVRAIQSIHAGRN